MSVIEEFNELTNIEEYLEFFDVDYDERLVRVKRFHILKKYGEMIEKAKEQNIDDEEKLLAFYKFALISTYKNFESGYSPSAAEIWNTFENPSACSTCNTSTDCNDIEEVSNGIHSCTNQPNISFN